MLCTVLDNIVRIQCINNNVRNFQEMTKAALSINELTELWVPELDHIDIIEQDQRMILHAKSDIERSADGMLGRGMENQNQNQISIAIQVFQNLSILEEKLKKVA